MLLQFLVVIFLILLIVDRWKPEKFVKLHRQLGNDCWYFPVVGNALNFLGNNEAKMASIIEFNLQSYKNKNLLSIWLGNKLVVGITGADDACAILKTALDKNYIYNFTRNFIGEGSIFAPVEIWHRKRKVLVPTFAPRHVSKFVTVFEAQSKVTADLIESKIGKGNFSSLEILTPYTLDTVCETLFGVNIDIQRQPNHPFFKAFTESLRNTAACLCQPWFQIRAIYKLSSLYARQKQLRQIIYEFIDDLILKKKTEINKKDGNLEGTDNEADKSKSEFKTFLKLMIENSNSDMKYTDKELREESLVFVIAGTDTTAVGACFTILMLSQHADVQDKVYREIQEVLGNSDKPLQSEDVLKLKYTRAVIKESLRLYPPVPIITRHCKNVVELPSGVVLPEGCDTVISIWGIQRNPEYWGKDANDFNPDHFMSGQVRNHNAFMAFSHGPRNCVGQQYAMLSITTTLVTMLRRYRFTPATNFKYDKNNPLRLSFEIMLKHVDNFSVQVEYRN